LHGRNRRADGSHSTIFRVDVVDRPKLDAVAVLVWRRSERGLEFLTRQNLRPAAYFRSEKTPVIAESREWLFCEEIVAGLLEPSDDGERAIRARAVEEVHEEAGLRVEVDAVRHLGPPFFVAPGIISEKIFLTEVDVTGVVATEPQGDGSPMEEGAVMTWRPLASLQSALATGEIQDAKTELALNRFLSRKVDAGQGA
jgi:ADP-ribose pyrophosphatase